MVRVNTAEEECTEALKDKSHSKKTRNRSQKRSSIDIGNKIKKHPQKEKEIQQNNAAKQADAPGINTKASPLRSRV